MTNYIARGRQVVIPLTNKSGGAVAAGDVVILSSGTAAAFTTTTSAAQSDDWVGVVYDASIAQDAIGLVILNGYVPLITLSGAASLGDYVFTHSVAKQAARSGTRAAGAFGQVLGTGTTPAAYIWGVPDPAGGAGGVATDTIWDAKGDLAVGTGANTAGILTAGTNDYVLTAASGEATGLKWAAAGGGRTLISEQTPTGTGTVTWSSIAGTYKSLEIEFVGRGTNASNEVKVNMYFNNDTTAANYRSVLHVGYQATGGATDGGDSASQIIKIAGASATAGYCGAGWIKIPFYAGTTFHKNAISLWSERDGSAELVTANSSLSWENTGAITRVDLVLAAGNWDTGSTLRLYGVA